MRLLLLFSLFFVTLTAYGAEDISGLLDYITRVNNNKFGEAATPISCEGGTEKSLEVQCARALCGDPSLYADTTVNASNYEKFITPEAMKEFGSLVPKIRQYVDRQVASTHALAEAVKRELKNNSAPIDLKYESEYEIDETARALFRSSFYPSIDQSKPLTERFELSVSIVPEDEGYSLPYMKALDAYITSYKKRLDEEPMLGLDINLYTVEEQRQLASDFVFKLKMLYSEIKGSSELSGLIESGDEDNIKELLATDFKSIEDQAIYYKLYELTNRINGLTFIKTGSYPSTYTLCDDNCRNALQDFLRQQDLAKDAKSLSDEAEFSSKHSDAVSRCQSAVYELGLKKYDADGIVKSIDEIINNIINNPLKKLSDESKKAFTEFVRGDINFQGERSEDEQGYKEMVENIKEFAENAQPEDYQNQTLGSLVLKLYAHKDGPGYFSVDYAEKLPCYGNSLFNITDYFQSKDNDPQLEKNKINISMYSALHLAAGKAITAHELGHALSFFASSKKLSEKSTKEYMGTRACISKLHQYETPAATYSYHEGEGIYVEEDVADYISYTAYNDGQLHECALLNTDNGEYTRLAIKSDDLSDPHSESFLRVIREAFMKDIEMPKSCSSVMEPYKDDIKFEKCL